MKNEKETVDIFRDELANEATEQEQVALEAWSQACDDNRSFRRLVKDMKLSAEVQRKSEAMKPSILQHVNKRITASQRFVRTMKIASVAAVVAVLLGITHHFSYEQGFRQVNSQPVEMENPLGMRSTITLPDGSKVILNAGTTITYPRFFVSKNREVILKGEAFFEVAPDATHPFIVKTDQIAVEVLGTQFNVKAYEIDERIEVSLLEGKVGVQKTTQPGLSLLTPGQQAYYDKKTGALTTRSVNITHYTSWKDGKYYFRALPLREITCQLERIFNVRIHIDSPALQNIIITGDFEQGENLDQILRVITADKRLKYRWEEEGIHIN